MKDRKEGPLMLAKRLIKILLLRAEEAKRGAYMKAVALTNKGLVIREIHGSKMYLNPKDGGLSTDLFIDKSREIMATNEFQKILKPGMVIADAGANIGYYALMEAKAVGENGAVYAIEPVPENVELLKKNVTTNTYKNIEVIKAAAGSKKGKAKFFVSTKSNLGSMVESANEKDIETEMEVDVLPLDTILKGKRSPDFVRMDVEGYELEILKGMTQVLKKKKLGLFIEVHAEFMGKDKTIEFFKLLKANGFKSCKIFHDLPGKMRAINWLVSNDVMPEFGEETKTIDAIIREQSPLEGVFHMFAQK